MSDDTCVVDDVLPRRNIFPGAIRRRLLDHKDAAIEASLISLLNFFFEPVRDAPVVHASPDGLSIKNGTNNVTFTMSRKSNGIIFLSILVKKFLIYLVVFFWTQPQF